MGVSDLLRRRLGAISRGSGCIEHARSRDDDTSVLFLQQCRWTYGHCKRKQLKREGGGGGRKKAHVMTSRAAGEGDDAGRRMSKSQFQAGEGDACTQGVLNTSVPARTSTYASTTAAFCPPPMYLRQAPAPRRPSGSLALRGHI